MFAVKVFKCSLLTFSIACATSLAVAQTSATTRGPAVLAASKPSSQTSKPAPRFAVREERGYIASKGGLSAGSTLVFEVRDRGSDQLRERITLNPDSAETGQYTWPYLLAKAVNAQSTLARVGEWQDGAYRPAYSSYLNTVWLPADLPLNFTYYIDDANLAQYRLVLQRLADAAAYSYSLANVKQWIAKERGGSFTDLNYPDNKKPLADTSVTGAHLDRVLQLASYAHQNRAECRNMTANCINVKDAQAAALRALLFLVDKNYQYSNWWNTSIGNPRSVARAALLLFPEITPNQLVAKLLPYLRVANVASGKNNWGANLIDYAAIQQMWAILALNGGIASAADLKLYDGFLRESTQTVSDLAVIQPGQDTDSCEGIRADMSFTSHCGTANGQLISQLYTAGYGYVFMDGILAVQNGVYGTDYAIPAKQFELLERWLIDGMGWSGYAGITDFHVAGRSHSRSTASFGGMVNKFTAKLLEINPNSPRKEILKELLHRGQTADESTNQYYRGNRYYWTTDNMFHFGPAYSASLRMVSTRTTTSETGNGEGLLSYFLGAGSQLLTRSGNEYRDIQPVWNWKRLPGITAEQDDLTLPLNEWGNTAYGSHSFVGGVSNGTLGLAAMELSRLNVANAHKSYFHFDDAILNIGSNIDTRQAKAEVVTSVEQALRQGDIQYRLKNNATLYHLQEGQRLQSGDIVWVQHNGIEYLFPASESQVITLQSQAQSGSWHDINIGTSSAQISKEVFSLWIAHSPGIEGHYLYYVQPAASFEMNNPQGLAEKRVSQLTTRRENWLHAVLDNQNNLGMAAVYQVKDEWFALTRDLQVKAMLPMLLLAKAQDSGETQITLSEPTQNSSLKKVQLQLKGRFLCTEGCRVLAAENDDTTLSVDLPSGTEIGKSVMIKVFRQP